MKARIQQEPRCVLLWQVAPGSAEHAAVEHVAPGGTLAVKPPPPRMYRSARP